MAVSRYFNHLDRKSEQDLFEDLVVEQIQLCGYDIWYVPRKILELDPILGDPVKVLFDKAYQIEALLPDAGNYGGDQAIMSKFGWRLNQTAEFMFAKRRFRELGIPGLTQPQPGDIIYIGNNDNPVASFTNTFFEINQVWYDYPGFEHGKQYCYKLVCETFTYSYEKFRTGFKAIDAMDQPVNPYQPNETDGSLVNAAIVEAKQNLLKFDTGNPFGEF